MSAEKTEPKKIPTKKVLLDFLKDNALPKPNDDTMTWAKDFFKNNLNEYKNYIDQESALNCLFSMQYQNNNVNYTLLKCAALNQFYSTNVKNLHTLAIGISGLKDFNKKIKLGDGSLVDEITPLSGKKRCFSFATKYCSHHNSKDYPIYDFIIAKILENYRDQNRGFSFKYKKLELDYFKNYNAFKGVIDEFIDYCDFKKSYTYKEIDAFLWLTGKEIQRKEKLVWLSSSA